MKTIIVLAALISSSVVLANNSSFWAADLSAAPVSLTQAHEAYAQGNYAQMADSVVKTLMTEADPVVRENAVQLFQAGVSASQGEIPANWTLPEGIEDMKVGVRYRTRAERSDYKLKVHGNLKKLGVLKQLQVVQFPNTVVMDKAAGIGEYVEQKDEFDGTPYYDLGSEGQKRPFETGLYLINIETASGEKVQGYFILTSDLNVAEAPYVKSPSEGQTFVNGTPTITWKDFHSSQYRPEEYRRLGISIVSVQPDGQWNDKWLYWAKDPAPNVQSVTVGKDGKGVKELENGDYLVVVGFSERHRFGPLQIARDAITLRNIHVKK